MRLRVTVTYEYDTNPEDYPEGERDPTTLAQYDIDTDPTIMLYGENHFVSAEAVEPKPIGGDS